MMEQQIDDVLDFWFAESSEALWFRSTPEFDDQIRKRFASTLELAKAGQLRSWEETASGALALCIVLDQFPMNLYRGSTERWVHNDAAVKVAQTAIENGFNQQLSSREQIFLYMPLMHSESLVCQDLCVTLFEALDLPENARYAKHHRDIIARFGRFPYRNELLGRDSTKEELAYLASDEAFKGT